MFEIRALYDTIRDLKKRGALYTNCFFLPPKMKSISEQEDSQIQTAKDYIVLLYNERNFQRLYFWCISTSLIAELYSTVQQLKEKNRFIVVDIVGTADYIRDVAIPFENMGARKYIVQSRYRATALRMVPVKTTDCVCALISPGDVQEALGLLESNLDPIVSHLPTQSYLHELQSENLVYGCYAHGQLIGVECLEPIGVKGRYIYQVVIKKEKQHQGYVMALKNYIAQCNLQCRPWTVWIDDTNSGSIYVHEQFGLKKDGVKNMVLVFE